VLFFSASYFSTYYIYIYISHEEVNTAMVALLCVLGLVLVHGSEPGNKELIDKVNDQAETVGLIINEDDRLRGNGGGDGDDGKGGRNCNVGAPCTGGRDDECGTPPDCIYGEECCQWHMACSYVHNRCFYVEDVPMRPPFLGDPSKKETFFDQV